MAGDVDGRRRHQLRRRRLVAAGRQHDTVDEVAVKRFHESQVAEVAIERGRRALACLLDRVQRKLERYTAGFADTLAHAMRELEVMPVARRKIGSRLGDADDRLSSLQLFALQAEVHVALKVERRHVGVVRIGEPFARAQPGGIFCDGCGLHPGIVAASLVR
jgi:hypothetical protein